MIVPRVAFGKLLAYSNTFPTINLQRLKLKDYYFRFKLDGGYYLTVRLWTRHLRWTMRWAWVYYFILSFVVYLFKQSFIAKQLVHATMYYIIASWYACRKSIVVVLRTAGPASVYNKQQSRLNSWSELKRVHRITVPVTRWHKALL